MRRHLLLAAAAALLGACANIGSPALTNVYEYRDVELGDTLIFHWPRTSLPVRVWVADDSPLRGNVLTAMDRWQNAFLYGEFSAMLVADSTMADVIVRNEPSDLAGGLSSRAPQCTGETDLDVNTSTNTLQLPMHIFVYATVSSIVPGIATCYSITVTHEFGHALGLILHSPFSSDVMFANPTFDGISDRDRQTAVTLYHVPSTLTLTGRR